MRDSFSKLVANNLARRAAFHCSNPSCRRVTVGPSGETASASIGVAAHITAASTGGPRYDDSLSPDKRSSIDNGIWLCQSCSRLVDVDADRHSTTILQDWKRLAEARAYFGQRGFEIIPIRSFAKLALKYPELIKEMRQDVANKPFTREFIAMSRKWTYMGKESSLFTYYIEDHDELLAKLKVCEKFGAIVETTSNSVTRYEFTEDFIEFLEQPP